MVRRYFDIIDGDRGTITVATGKNSPRDIIRYEGRKYARDQAFQEEDGTWTAVYRELSNDELSVWNLWDNIFSVNGGMLAVFQHSVGREVPPTEFVRFRKSESPFVPLVISPPPQPPQQSFGSYLRQQRDAVCPDLERNRYGAATSAGRFVPAYFSGMDTRTPEGLGFPGRLVLTSSLPGGRQKQ